MCAGSGARSFARGEDEKKKIYTDRTHVHVYLLSLLLKEMVWASRPFEMGSLEKRSTRRRRRRQSSSNIIFCRGSSRR